MTSRPVTAAVLRAALSPHAAGVVLMTTFGDQGPLGLTVTAFAAASLDPPLIIACLQENSKTLRVLRPGQRFAIHVLSSEEESLAIHFASSGIHKFGARVGWQDERGVPMVDGGLADVVCYVQQLIPVGDHCAVIGRVVWASAHSHDRALVHRLGALHAV